MSDYRVFAAVVVKAEVVATVYREISGSTYVEHRASERHPINFSDERARKLF